MSLQETTQEFNPGVDKIWNSFNQGAERTAQAERNVQRDFGLPIGFVTEKGSAYSYGKDGSIHRDKFDGTQHDAGIAVFIDDSEENRDALTRIGAISSHLPPEMQKKIPKTPAPSLWQINETVLFQVLQITMLMIYSIPSMPVRVR